MPPIYADDAIYAGIHDFKTNISKYLRKLDSGDYKNLFIMRRGTVVGLVMSMQGQEIRQQRAKLAQLSDPNNGPENRSSGFLSGPGFLD